MESSQRPLSLILARNLLTSLRTPGFLVGHEGKIVFYNEAAGILLGRRFEDGGPLDAEQWTELFGPFNVDGTPMSYEEIALTGALRADRAAHARLCIRTHGDRKREIDTTALPIYGDAGFAGAMVFFWPVEEDA